MFKNKPYSLPGRSWCWPVWVLAVSMALGGCAQLPKVADQDPAWSRIVFYWQWPDAAAPAWHREVWLADAVIAPLLAEHAGDIALWRVHRRALRAQYGHFFSWYVYASPAVGEQLFQQVSAHAAVQQMLQAGWLQKVEKLTVTAGPLPLISATSDRAWDDSLQAAWPLFAMGVSAAWLDLIERWADPPTHADARALDAYYLALSDRIDHLWQNQGGHAFLHHLNAIFGYLPVFTRPGVLQQF